MSLQKIQKWYHCPPPQKKHKSFKSTKIQKNTKLDKTSPEAFLGFFCTFWVENRGAIRFI
jgi:hypothetical protein